MKKPHSRREWIDEMFGDLKDNGFDLESLHFAAWLIALIAGI